MILQFHRIVLYKKISIKCEQQKVKKIPHTALEKNISQIVTQIFCKIGLNPKPKLALIIL